MIEEVPWWTKSEARRAPAMAEAMCFLLTHLENGPQWSKTLLTLAEGAGVSEQNVNRAARQLAMIRNWQKTSQGVWRMVWELSTNPKWWLAEWRAGRVSIQEDNVKLGGGDD